MMYSKLTVCQVSAGPGVEGRRRVRHIKSVWEWGKNENHYFQDILWFGLAFNLIHIHTQDSYKNVKILGCHGWQAVEQSWVFVFDES